MEEPNEEKNHLVLTLDMIVEGHKTTVQFASATQRTHFKGYPLYPADVSIANNVIHELVTTLRDLRRFSKIEGVPVTTEDL